MPNQPAQRAVAETIKHDIAAYICKAREYAEVIALAHQYGEPLEPTTEDVLDRDALDALLDPAHPSAQRFQLFRRLLSAAVVHQRIAGLDAQAINDERLLRGLWEETCSWGDALHQLLDNTAITEITITGATAIGKGPQERRLQQSVFTSPRDVLNHAEFLATSMGVAWNRSAPTTLLMFRSGTRVLLMREPDVSPTINGMPGVLINIRRGRAQPWTLATLVEHELLDRQAAAVLAPLLHAGCSFIVNGKPNSGRAAMLEGLLNVRRPDTHLVVIEDKGSQLHPTGIITCVQSVSTPLPAVADMVTLHVAAPEAASFALHQAESGVPTLLTLQADTPAAALHCFARLVAENKASRTDEALKIITATFQVIIQMAYSHRLGQRYVRAVLLLDGHTPNSEPIRLIEASVGEEQIAWTCHAQVQERKLVWKNAAIQTPSLVTMWLADIPDAVWEHLEYEPLTCPPPLETDGVDTELASVLRRARNALREEAWVDAAALLTRAAQLRDDQAVGDLIDHALQIPAFVEPIDREIAESVRAARAALEHWNVDHAQTILDTAPSSPLLVRRRTNHPAWKELTAQIEQIQSEIAVCQLALQRASTHRQAGDITQALVVIRPITIAHLPPALARTLLTARRSLLSQIIAQTQDDPAVQQEYVTELEQVNRELTAHEPGAAAPARPATRTETATPAQAQIEPVSEAAQPARQGWLDAALAHNRERARLRQAAQAPVE